MPSPLAKSPAVNPPAAPSPAVKSPAGTSPATQSPQSPVNEHVFAVLVDNEPGVLARVIGLFSGRGYNIESLSVSEIDHDSRRSRITIVTSGDEMVIAQIRAQLDRLVPVHKVSDLTLQQQGCVACDLALLKIVGDAGVRSRALKAGGHLGARLVDSGDQSCVVLVAGDSGEIDAYIRRLRGGGLTEISRTGAAAVARGAASF